MRENVSAVSGAGQQFVMRIEGQGVDDVFVRSPNSRRRAIGGNAVHIGATTGASAGKWEWAGLRAGWASGSRVIPGV